MNKWIILLIIFTIGIFPAAGQGRLVFTPSTWDFGTIPEADGRVTHTFTGINQGNKPVVILDIVTTCGCTVPSFTKQPILPGGKTEISVTFDPTNRPGTFSKELTVYSIEKKKIASLIILGNVTPRPKTTEELYPIDGGNGLKLASNLSAFSYIYQGKAVAATIAYTNTSARVIALELRPEAQSGLLTINAPRWVAPGEQGEIRLSYLIPADKPRYGTLRDVFEVFTDSRSNGIKIVAQAIGVDNPENIDISSAPKLELSENIIKFGAVKRSAGAQRQPLTLSNTGSAPLIIRAVETSGDFTCTLRPGQSIAPGSTLKAEVTINPAVQQTGVMAGQLVLITSDPSRPMRRMRVTAIMED